MSFIDSIKKTTTTIGKVVKDTYGPLAALENRGSYEGTIYRYPLEVGDSNRYPHTVEFQTWIPTQVNISDLGIGETGTSVGGAFDAFGNVGKMIANKAGELANKAKQVIDKNTPDWVPIKYKEGINDNLSPEWLANEMKVTRNKRWNDNQLDWTRRAEPADLIAMYMPAGGWMDRISNQYNQQSMTAALGNLGLTLEAGSSIIKEFQDSNGDTWGKIKDMINGPQGAEVLGGIAGGLGMDGGVITSAGLNAMGYALNPQFEMLYGGTDLREFQFDFTMTPRSQKEAETIRKIIKKFKYHASPAYVNGQGRYIVPPSYFDITFKFNGAPSEWLPQISTCVLKSFDVDYTGGLEQWSTHADGSPIQVKMTMVFAELEMMHKSLRKKGY